MLPGIAWRPGQKHCHDLMVLSLIHQHLCMKLRGKGTEEFQSTRMETPNREPQDSRNCEFDGNTSTQVGLFLSYSYYILGVLCLGSPFESLWSLDVNGYTAWGRTPVGVCEQPGATVDRINSALLGTLQ